MDVLVTKAVKFLSTSISKSQHTEFFKVRGERGGGGLLRGATSVL